MPERPTGYDRIDVPAALPQSRLRAIKLPETGTVCYSDAGHSIAHHFTAEGKATQLRASGPPLGIMPDYRWTTERLLLKPGESLIMPSDGILELVNDDIQRLQDELWNLTAQGTDTKASIKALINAPLHPTDDLTLLAIRRLA
ncbi:PP2C family protein-serine/threonine phosphatase [Arthrobacter sp. MPF02]|uniref:PP2C family protein-serine/threonine phosphatase n=1 Tax=Arthrobacter sp. MPF02 TaxID=3388492 RepID=UPI0039848643